MASWVRQWADQPVAVVIQHLDAGSQYTTIRYTQRLAQANAVASIGTIGDSYDEVREHFLDNASVIMACVRGIFAERVKVRRAAAGLTQRELAAASGVKQPLIAAIESGARQPNNRTRDAIEGALAVRPAQLLRVARDETLALVHAMGGTDVRVFGSVADGTDLPTSDIDLLVTFPPGSDIVTLLRLQEDLSTLLTVPVDVVSAGSSGPVLERALAEAVPL